MANWAIVVGINQYWKPQACLKGAINDALKITDWLLKPDGGDVPPANLRLLASPQPPNIPSGVARQEASMNNLLRTIDELLKTSNATGERFFFYFSGHGLTNREAFSDEQALVMADFDETLTTNSIKLRSIYEKFQATEFREQFYFIDACRNVLRWDGELITGVVPRPGVPQLNNQPPAQFIFFSTSPRSKSWEGAPPDSPGTEQGAFTGALLDGLRGAGAAKIWDDEDKKYVVPTDRLFKFVETQVVKRQINVSSDPLNPIFQRPRIDGERGADSPVLAKLNENQVEKVDLSLDVSPEACYPSAKVEIESVYTDFTRTVKPITGKPVTLGSLSPMMYTLSLAAEGYEAERKRYPLEIYEPLSLTIDMKPAPPPPSPVPASINIMPAPAGSSGGEKLFMSVSDSAAFRSLDDDAPSLPPPHRAPTPPNAKLTIQAGDDLATLELADATGHTLQTAQGSLTRILAPGIYRARLVSPEGEPVEQMLSLEAGDDETLTLDAPPLPHTPFTDELINAANFTREPDNTLDVSERVGKVAAPQLTTILSLAGAALNDDDKSWGSRLRGIGLQSFRESVGTSAADSARSGLQLFIADELVPKEKAQDYLSEFKIELWSPSVSINGALGLSSQIAGLGEFSAVAEPGAHWLSIQLPEQNPVVLYVALLPGRLTTIVVQVNSAHQSRIFQYLPSLYQDPTWNQTLLRRLDLLQRFCSGGQNTYAYPNAIELLECKWQEPIAGCLGGYLMLQLGKPHELGTAAQNMTRYFGELSDSHVLQAEYLLSQKRETEALSSLNVALERGLPICAEGLARLYARTKQYEIKHPQIKLLDEMFEQRVAGLLWSAYIPDHDTDGKLIFLQKET